MFLLRCAFWLSVVYASMAFGLPHDAAPHSAVGAVQAASVALDAGAVAARAATGVMALCDGRVLDCARDAAAMTALVEATTASVPGDGAEGEALREDPASGAAAVAPMPPPDPRRRARLTRRS